MFGDGGEAYPQGNGESLKVLIISTDRVKTVMWEKVPTIKLSLSQAQILGLKKLFTILMKDFDLSILHQEQNKLAQIYMHYNVYVQIYMS